MMQEYFIALLAVYLYFCAGLGWISYSIERLRREEQNDALVLSFRGQMVVMMLWWLLAGFSLVDYTFSVLRGDPSE